MCAAKAGPAIGGFTDARPITGPPVFTSFDGDVRHGERLPLG